MPKAGSRRQAEYAVPKTEKVIGAQPTQYTRVRIRVWEETLQNRGGGTRWQTTGVTESIVVHSMGLAEAEKIIIETMERAHTSK